MRHVGYVGPYSCNIEATFWASAGFPPPALHQHMSRGPLVISSVQSVMPGECKGIGVEGKRRGTRALAVDGGGAAVWFGEPFLGLNSDSAI